MSRQVQQTLQPLVLPRAGRCLALPLGAIPSGHGCEACSSACSTRCTGSSEGVGWHASLMLWGLSPFPSSSPPHRWMVLYSRWLHTPRRYSQDCAAPVRGSISSLQRSGSGSSKRVGQGWSRQYCEQSIYTRGELAWRELRADPAARRRWQWRAAAWGRRRRRPMRCCYCCGAPAAPAPSRQPQVAAAGRPADGGGRPIVIVRLHC